MTFLARHAKPCLAALALLLAAAITGCAQQDTEKLTTKYMFWPPAPDAPHIQFLTSFSSSSDVTGEQTQIDTLLYGKEDARNQAFARPFGIRMIGGCIYVCDATSGSVAILDLRKHEVRILGKTGQATLRKPIDVAVAPDGDKYVADTGYGAVVVYDAKDAYAGNIKLPNLRPVSLAIKGDELYVADIYSSLVRVFDRFNGKELRTIGKPLTEEDKNGGLGGVMGIALDPQGNIYANDVIGCRVQEFTADGKFIRSLGKQGDRPGNFVRPKQMAVDSDGILYVVDNAFQNVQMFNDKGQMLMFFGSAGSHPGAMNMPSGICTSDQDLDLFQKYVHPDFQLQRLIFVTNNAGGARINVYGLGTLKPGKTVADIAASRVNGVMGFESQPNTAPLESPDELLMPAPASQPAAPATQPAAPATQPASQPATSPKIQEPKPF